MKTLAKTQITYEQDVVSVRQRTRHIAELLKFEAHDQNRIATAVSEIARNAFLYGGGGEVSFLFNSDASPQALYVEVSDSGPGIANVDQLLNGQLLSTSAGGSGLLGAKKLMDFFEMKSEPGKGTKVTVGKTLRRTTKALGLKEIAELSEKLSEIKPHSVLQEVQLQNRALILALDELNTKQQELTQLNRELADTNSGVVALYAELDEKAASLQKANEVKTSFLSNMTHEFRTPLSSIISLTRLLLDRVDGELTSEQERQVKYIYKSADGLLELVNDLLDLAKVEAGKISIHPVEFDLDTFLGAQRGMFKPLLGANSKLDLDMRNEVRDLLFTDEAKLSQILRNLISNAIKYSESGTIAVSARNDLNDTILFSVADNGIGIEQSHLETIFEDFSQIESNQQKKSKGTGLGLPLSRRLANLLGGDLWAESKIHKGSTFHARIPRVYAGQSEGTLFHAESPTRSPQHPSRYKILLIDDDEPSRYLLKGLISDEITADFLEASNGADGLRQLREVQPDVAFLDLSMPGLNGFDIIEQWSAERTGQKNIPLIVNTARLLTIAEENFLRKHTLAVFSKTRTRSAAGASEEIRSLLSKAGLLKES